MCPCAQRCPGRLVKVRLVADRLTLRLPTVANVVETPMAVVVVVVATVVVHSVSGHISVVGQHVALLEIQAHFFLNKQTNK